VQLLEQVEEAAGILANPKAVIHLVGIGGSGMAGLARLLDDAGYPVTGSDQRSNEVTRSLQERGIPVACGHAADHIGSRVDAVVYSTAIHPDNPERLEAERRKIPQFRRAEALAAHLRSKKVIAVAGTHGKTTTAMILTHLLREAGGDPTFYIGAEVPTFGASAAGGHGEWAVVEADESDGTFLAFQPEHVLILNMDRDHMDFFENDEQILDAFRELASRANGACVVCGDDAGSRRLGEGLEAPVWYGLEAGTRVRLIEEKAAGDGSDLVLDLDGSRVEAHLGIPGRHNVSNALGALTMAGELGLDLKDCAAALASLRGASRRFQLLLQKGGGRIVDDYAHHPVEIRATLATARRVSDRPVTALFQPHRYSRTQALMPDFAEAFEEADRVWIGDVYGAGECYSGPNLSAVLAHQMAERCKACEHRVRLTDLAVEGVKAFRQEETVLTLGAGNIGNVAESMTRFITLADQLEERLSPGARVLPLEPLKRHTTLRIGGPADLWCEVVSEDDVAAALAFATENDLPWMVLGRGSNLLVRDGGIRGLVLHLKGDDLTRIETSGATIRAGAGARLKEISYSAMKAGISGFEFMEGIPASLGGALRMNAGAMQSWMFEVVQELRVATEDGRIRNLSAGDVEVHYRNVPALKKAVALGARMEGSPDLPEAVKARMKQYSEKRWASQPAAPSAGCTFKNPDSIPAGKLIDELGLKDLTVGKARISSVHANFIVNDGGATADEVLELIRQVQARAREERGVDLELEVVVLGED